MRHAFVERIEANTTGFAVRPGPDWRQIVRGGDFTLQRLGCIRSGNAPRHLAVLRRKGVFQSMDQEFFKTSNIRFVFQRGTMQKLRASQALNGSMNFRRPRSLATITLFATGMKSSGAWRYMDSYFR